MQMNEWTNVVGGGEEYRKTIHSTIEPKNETKRKKFDRRWRDGKYFSEFRMGKLHQLTIRYTSNKEEKKATME